MMEALQIGPGAFGPMAQSAGGGCVFNCGLGRGVSERMSLEKTIKAQAVDLATAKSEIVDLDPIGVYKLKVQRARFMDKATGENRDELTLVSPDFDNEPIGKWTDAGENGTGTRREYKKIVDWAGELAAAKGEATLIWVSPGERINDTNGSIAPEHRAYVLRKDESGNVLATSYQLTGEKSVLAKMMKKLGYQEDGEKVTIEDKHIILKGSSAGVSHKEVYEAYTASLSREELRNNKTFIQRFQKDALEATDQERMDKFRKNTQQYEKQLGENYKGDIESALKSIAQGVFVAVRTGVERIDEPVKPQAADIRAGDRIIPADFMINDRAAAAYYDFNNRKTEESSSEEMFTQVKELLQPVMPGVIGLSESIVAGTVSITSDKVGGNTPELLPVTSTTGEGIPVVVQRLEIDDVLNPETDSELFWREFISAVFLPPEEITTESQMLFYEQADTKGLSDVPAGFMSFADADSIDGFKQTDGNQKFAEFEADLQTGLGIISEFIVNREEKQLTDKQAEGEKIKEKIIETQILSIGKALLKELSGNGVTAEFSQTEERSRIQLDSLSLLSLLVKVYEEPNEEEVKRLLAVLVYEQIQKIAKDRELSVGNPQIEDILKKFDTLTQHTDFLDDKFDFLLAVLQKIYPGETFDRDQLISLIFTICRTPERLTRLGNMKTRYMGFLQDKKKRQKVPNSGIIFLFTPGVIYQYHSTCNN